MSGGRYSVRSVLDKEPAVIAGAVQALLNVGAIAGLDLTTAELGALNVAVIAVLTLFVRATSTPNVNVPDEPVDDELEL